MLGLNEWVSPQATCERVHHGSDFSKDYYTDLLANDTLAFIRNVSLSHPEDPFLAVVHTPAPHVPNVCSPKYCGLFNGTEAPRVASWNQAPSMDKHWMMRQIPPMNKYTQVRLPPQTPWLPFPPSPSRPLCCPAVVRI